MELPIWSVQNEDSDIYQIQIIQRNVITQWNRVIREKYLFYKNRNLLNKHSTFLVPKAKQSCAHSINLHPSINSDNLSDILNQKKPLFHSFKQEGENSIDYFPFLLPSCCRLFRSCCLLWVA